LAFIHIPKTGGHPIATSSLFADALEHHPIGGHGYIEDMMKDPGARGLEHGYHKIGIIRHPCSRFISTFHLIQHKSSNGNDKSWASKHIGNATLAEFVVRLENRGWPKGLGGKIEEHFGPQYPYLFYRNRTFATDTLICQEQWEVGIGRLIGDIGASRHVPEELVTAHTRHMKHDETCSSLDSNIRAAIEQYYAMDYCARCTFFDRNLHSRMPLVPTPARFTSSEQACDQ
jgi:hypothetical protein